MKLKIFKKLLSIFIFLVLEEESKLKLAMSKKANI